MTAPAPVGSPPTAPGPAPAATGFDFGRVVAGLILAALGVVWLLDATDVVRARAGVVLPALLITVGVALVVGSWQGSHPSLITVGVLLAVATVFGALAPPEALRGGVGQRTYTVETMNQLKARYQVGLGDLTLDLSKLDLTGNRRVEVHAGVGDVVVVIPPEAEVTVDASVGAGEITLFDDDATNGVSVRRTIRQGGDDGSTGSLDLRIELGVGRIEVRP